jgi:hypothetical protein
MKAMKHKIEVLAIASDATLRHVRALKQAKPEDDEIGELEALLKQVDDLIDEADDIVEDLEDE